MHFKERLVLLEKQVESLKQDMSDIRNVVLKYNINPGEEINTVLALKMQIDILDILDRRNI